MLFVNNVQKLDTNPVIERLMCPETDISIMMTMYGISPYKLSEVMIHHGFEVYKQDSLCQVANK
jgi:hypothetical protein